MITSEVLVAYDQCQLKSYSLLHNDKGIPNEYISHLKEETHKNRSEYSNKIKQKYPDAQPYSIPEMQKETNILIDANLEAGDLSAYADVLAKSENIPYKLYIPTIVVGTHKIHKEHRLQLAFASYVLSKLQKQKPSFGSIVGGDKRVHRIKTEFLYKEVEQSLRKLRGWESGKIEQPSIILNKHCPYCPFQKECKLEAKEKDHLSLLRGMSEKEIITQNKRGIFTVTQFSHTFRPRKNKSRKHTYNHALKALAIRNGTIYVVKSTPVSHSKVEIFFDVEGIPDQNFYYLIGGIINDQSNIKKFSFWADTEKDEPKIWKNFLETLTNYKDFTLFHYGSFETQFFKRLGEQYTENAGEQAILEKIKTNSVNVLSQFYGEIYFPTYSNGLKDIGKYLDRKWSEDNATGLQSLVWRSQWETTHDSCVKDKLIQYNLEDCSVLRTVVETISKISSNSLNHTEVVSVDDIHNESTYKFGPSQYLFQELEFVNKCAYFDYQREKIYFRNRKKSKHKVKDKTRISQKYRINKIIKIPTPSNCYKCESSELYGHGRKSKIVWDVKFFDFGVKRWVVKYETGRVRCGKCGLAFPPAEFQRIKTKYGFDLKIWVVYQIIALRQTFNKVQQSLWDIFRYKFHSNICQKAKYEMADYYTPTCQQFLNKLRDSPLIHADETSVSIQGKSSYIWVFTSLEEVLYIYSPSREGDILREILEGFKGVLVSDFYSAYDSVECPQQKCLIHLIRDMNGDLIKNPFDEEYKKIIKNFSELLQDIILTVDKYGLKKRYLRKHQKEAVQFIEKLLSFDSESEVILQYQKRFKKYRDKLFTFLDYDGIPWNNNNAEHAIKTFAVYRKITDGCFTENGIKKYLTLLSVYQTCQYKNIDFLRFLRSREIDFVKFCKKNEKNGNRTKK